MKFGGNVVVFSSNAVDLVVVVICRIEGEPFKAILIISSIVALLRQKVWPGPLTTVAQSWPPLTIPRILSYPLHKKQPHRLQFLSLSLTLTLPPSYLFFRLLFSVWLLHQHRVVSTRDVWFTHEGDHPERKVEEGFTEFLPFSSRLARRTSLFFLKKNRDGW